MLTVSQTGTIRWREHVHSLFVMHVVWRSGMSTEPIIQRVLLAVEDSDLEPGARQYCTSLIPDGVINLQSLDAFVESLEGEYHQDELRVLMLHADEDGQLGEGSPIVHSIMNSQLPVLVTRHSLGGTAPDPRVKRIVVPLDGSTTAGQAIPIASRIARMLKVPVRFMMVIDPARVIPPAYAYDPEAWGMIEELRQTSHWALSQAETVMRRDGVTASSDLLLGPINASLAISIGEGDLVVMTTHGPDWSGPRYRDSVALRTLLTVPQPMLIMRAERDSPVVVDAY